MEKIAVFVNDAVHARRILRPLLEGGAPTHWVVVACPPTLARHVSRWVSQGARRQWRERWSEALFAELAPELGATRGSRVETQIARRPLTELSTRLLARLPDVRLLDARMARLGKPDEPISATQPVEPNRWAAPIAITTGLSALLTLAD